MTDTAAPPRRTASVLWLVRRVVGFAGLLVAGAAGVLFLLGSWNPWQLVVLEYRFGNPMIGLLLVPAITLVSLWLALPVRNEVSQRGRITARWLAAAVTLVGLFGWGIFSDHFSFDEEELARSYDGQWAIAAVTDRDVSPTTYLRVWRGSGLSTREVAELGRICSAVSVEFLTAHQIEISGSYGDWRFDLDPETGAPQQVLGPGCTDGPVPAG